MIILSHSSKKPFKKGKKSKTPIGEIKDVTITYPGIFENKAWKVFRKLNY